MLGNHGRGVCFQGRGEVWGEGGDGVQNCGKTSMHLYNGKSEQRFLINIKKQQTQVCFTQSEAVCQDQETEKCSLVQDVLCRNITETR